MDNEIITTNQENRQIGKHDPFLSLDMILAGQLADSSIAMYRRDVDAYQSFAKGHTPGLDPLQPETLGAWRDHLAYTTTMSPHTINRMLSAVRRVIKQAAANGHLPTSRYLRFKDTPGVKVKSLKKRLKKYARTRISAQDMRRLCDAPESTTFVGKRDRAILATLASSGVRASELATLTREQIVEQGEGHILKVCGKTDTEYRDAYLSAEAYTLILDWLLAYDAYVAARHLPETSPFVFIAFGGRGQRLLSTHLSDTAVWQVVTKYARQCDLAHVKPHDFRRYLGTTLAKTNIRTAQKALGHKSIEVTAKYYVLDELTPGLTDNLY